MSSSHYQTAILHHGQTLLIDTGGVEDQWSTISNTGTINIEGGLFIADSTITGNGVIDVNDGGSLDLMAPGAGIATSETINLMDGTLYYGYGVGTPTFVHANYFTFAIQPGSVPFLNITNLAEIVVAGRAEGANSTTGLASIGLQPYTKSQTILEVLGAHAMPTFAVGLNGSFTLSEIHMRDVGGNAVITFSGNHAVGAT